MSVTITPLLTEIYDADATTSWSAGSTYSGFQREGSNCLGGQASQGTFHALYSTSLDLTSTLVYSWMQGWGSPETKANGGFRIVLGDGTNERAYYVGGSDDYGFQLGLWSCFVLDTANLASYSFEQLTGSLEPTLSAITEVGVGVWLTNKALGNVDNFFWDIARYGAGLQITAATAGTFAEIAADDALTTAGKAYGVVREIQSGVYGVQGELVFGDDIGTNSVDFADSNATLVFENTIFSDTVYGITLTGNGTGTTDFQLGSVVGSGDSRQGVAGGTLSTAGPAWEFDAQTNIANIDSCNLYGTILAGAQAGISLDDGLKTSLVSATIVNSFGPDVGTINDGAELLNCFILDPTGLTNNYGLNFPQAPTVGELVHNCTNINFITSGSPTTQYMTQFSYAGDYAISWDTFNFFGDYSSGTLWHGINTGLNADITINVTDGGNASASEFSNTNGGTVTVNNAVVLTVTCIDSDTLSPVEGARVRVEADIGGPETAGTVLIEGATDVNGQVTNSSYNYSGDQPLIGYSRKGTTSPLYKESTIAGTITSAGFSQTVAMVPDE